MTGEPSSLSGPDGSLRRAASPLGALFAVQMATAFIPIGVGAFAVYLRGTYDLSRGEVGLATSVTFACVALASIPAGHLVDRIGITAGMIAASTVVAVGVLGLGLADSYPAVLSWLALVGVGYAAVTPTTNKGVLAVAPPDVRGMAMGVKQMGVTAGGATAAALLPGAIQRAGWSTSLSVTAGAILLLGGAAAAVFGRSVRAVPSSLDRTQHRGRLTSRRRLVALGTVIGGLVAAQYAVATYLALFLAEARSLSPTEAGAYLTVLHVSGTLARVAWGAVSDRRPAGRLGTIIAIASISAGSLIALATTGAVLPGVALVALVAVLGMATQGGNAVYQTAIAEEDEERAGWASGLGMSMGFAGAIVAPPAFGTAVDVTGSYAIAWALLGAVVALAGAGAVLLRRIPRPLAALSGSEARPPRRRRLGPDDRA